MDQLIKRLRSHCVEGSVVNLSDAYTGLTLDVISEYCLGVGTKSLETADYGGKFRQLIVTASHVSCYQRHLPLLFNTLMRLPPSIIEKMNRRSAELSNLVDKIGQQARSIVNSKGDDKPPHRTILHELVESSLPEEEKTAERMRAEGFILIAAGTETTARTLSVISFYLISQPAILQKVREELKSVMPSVNDPISSSELERLPYLVKRHTCT